MEVLPENVPDGFVDAGYNAFGGSFIFDKGKIITAPVDYELKAQRKISVEAISSTFIAR